MENGYLQAVELIANHQLLNGILVEDLQTITNTNDQTHQVVEQQKRIASELKLLNNNTVIEEMIQQITNRKNNFVEPVVKHMFKMKNETISCDKNDQATSTTPDESKTILAMPSTVIISANNDNDDNNKSGFHIKAPKQKLSLSKLIEYPGDPLQLNDILLPYHQLQSVTCDDNSNCIDSSDKKYIVDNQMEQYGKNIDLNGKDMYGLTALMKYAAWNKVDLVRMLLPYLTAEQVNTRGGSKDQQYTCLHYCIDMEAVDTLAFLLKEAISNGGKVDTTAVDAQGRTYIEYSRIVGKQHMIDILFHVRLVL